jgi:hypothetical protein
MTERALKAEANLRKAIEIAEEVGECCGCITPLHIKELESMKEELKKYTK